MRGRAGVWLAVATLVAYWGLAGVGFLLRVRYDPAVNAPMSSSGGSAGAPTPPSGP